MFSVSRGLTALFRLKKFKISNQGNHLIDLNLIIHLKFCKVLKTTCKYHFSTIKVSKIIK